MSSKSQASNKKKDQKSMKKILEESSGGNISLIEKI